MMIAWLGCVAPEVPPPPEPVARFQCERCHSGAPVFVAAPEERSCVGCHRAILDGEYDYRYLPKRVAGWKRHLHRINEVPTLDALSERVTRRWFIEMLLSPSDTRPGIPASMPRLPIAYDEAAAIADLFGLVDLPPDPLAGDPVSGRVLLDSRCLPCHTGADPLAIDLAIVRERGLPQWVDRWLASPRAVLPGTRMPEPHLSDIERADVVAALFAAPPERVQPPTVPASVVIEREVSWEEVDTAVFHEVCRHCHADPVPVGGDGGPGNTGGFGYAGAGLDLSSEASLRLHPELLAPRPDGTFALTAHLWARHEEVAGRPGVLLGMPLGLPPLPPERIALVDAWIRGSAIAD